MALVNGCLIQKLCVNKRHSFLLILSVTICHCCCVYHVNHFYTGFQDYCRAAIVTANFVWTYNSKEPMERR